MELSTVVAEGLDHEQVIVRRGERSGLPVIVAVHSTKLGSAVGGCRLWTYDDWRGGLADALRLSEAMSLKCAAAGLEHGGGKSVIAVPTGTTLDAVTRADAMRDLGDVVESLGGRYVTGEDVGTGPDDLRAVRERTRWAAEPPATPGEPTSEPTSLGVYEAIKATVRHISGSDRLDGVRITVVGLGHVGLPLAHRLAFDGARLLVSDIDLAKKQAALDLGARWADPADALFAEADVLAPAALGGVFSPEAIGRLRCAAIAGAANNQLSEPRVADLLTDRGIVWVPDFVANAGGVIHGVRVALDGIAAAQAMEEVRGIGTRVASILARAAETGTTPLSVATSDARLRLAEGA
jgi:leucine dehydrogenase